MATESSGAGRIATHLRVTGRVQGVGFRYFVYEVARDHGVGGWVRNLPDGAVEAVVEGEPDAVEQVVGAISVGPGYGRVDHVERRRIDPTGTHRGFRVRY